MVFSGCGCVLRLRPSRFPFFLLFFSSSSRAPRRSRSPYFLPSFPSSSIPCFIAFFFLLASASGCPAVAADLSSVLALTLCAFPSACFQSFPPSSYVYLPVLADPPPIFPLFSLLPLTDMRHRPVCLPCPVTLLTPFPHPCMLPSFSASASSCPASICLS